MIDGVLLLLLGNNIVPEGLFVCIPQLVERLLERIIFGDAPP
jgi:hypothetical protein